MKTIEFYLDFISPYAWLGFDALPRALQGISHRVVHKPVLFAAMLKHNGQLGPAEIPAKRDWTYRQVLWQARQQGTPMQLPATHPFNPLDLLRLATACDADGQPNRYVCEQVFRHVWCSGLEAADPQRLAQLTAQLKPARDPSDADVKQALQVNTHEALAHGVFGVPSFRVDDKVFWDADQRHRMRFVQYHHRSSLSTVLSFDPCQFRSPSCYECL
jgi:2-hydroxychromene-2-carboxylate isomerase